MTLILFEGAENLHRIGEFSLPPPKNPLRQIWNIMAQDETVDEIVLHRTEGTYLLVKRKTEAGVSGDVSYPDPTRYTLCTE